MTLVLAAILAAAPVTLEADPNNSTVGFSVKHMLVTTVRGQFPKFSSTLNWNKDDASKSAIELKVDPASINTNNEKRDGHLKSPFGTTVYPASATGKLKRSEWGLTWNKALETGGAMVSDDVNLDLEFEFLPKAAEGKKEAQAETKAKK